MGKVGRLPGKSPRGLLSTQRGYERCSREALMMHFPSALLCAQSWSAEPILHNQRTQISRIGWTSARRGGRTAGQSLGAVLGKRGTSHQEKQTSPGPLRDTACSPGTSTM